MRATVAVIAAGLGLLLIVVGATGTQSQLYQAIFGHTYPTKGSGGSVFGQVGQGAVGGAIAGLGPAPAPASATLLPAVAAYPGAPGGVLV